MAQEEPENDENLTFTPDLSATLKFPIGGDVLRRG